MIKTNLTNKLLATLIAAIIITSAVSVISNLPSTAAQTKSNDKPIDVNCFRGAWYGKIEMASSSSQLNLYFTELIPIVNQPDKYKISGYITIDELGGQKRAKADCLPLLAQVEFTTQETCKLSIYANIIAPDGQGTVIKLDGTAIFGSKSVIDDSTEGTWAANIQNTLITGTWSAVHLDRRNVKPQEVSSQDSFYFNVDFRIHLSGSSSTPLEQRNPQLQFDVYTNIVTEQVKVISPDGQTIILRLYSDLFNMQGTDFITQFRFEKTIQSLPTKYQPYVFMPLDAAGNPIPGIQATDDWQCNTPPIPPSNLQAQMLSTGLMISWDQVPSIEGTFNPEQRLGFYQLAISEVLPQGQSGKSIYGTMPLQTTNHIAPLNQMGPSDLGVPLSEFSDGTYMIMVTAFSVSTDNHTLEYSSRDPIQALMFQIVNGQIVSL
jgi:hypothetical protein